MNQAILNLIDKKMNDEYYENPEPENWNGVLTGAFFENFIESLKEEISSLPSDTQWIEIAIQLPPEDTNVLLFEGGQSNLSGWNEPKIGWYNPKFGFQSLTDYVIATHWMPLPLPPK